MRAVRLASFVGENIRIEEVSDPDAGPREVAIGTEAATINQADQMSGGMAPFLPLSDTAPYTQEWDLACHLLAVVDGVKTSLVGSRVVGSRIELPGGQRL